MHYTSLVSMALAAGLVLGVAAPVSAHGTGFGGGEQAYGWQQGHMGPGMMGQGMGPGMMNPGYMGQGMGPGMMMNPGYMGQGMGPGMMMNPRFSDQGRMQPLRNDLGADDVRHMMEHRLAWQGNPNIKLGNVEEIDEDSIVAEIVTQDGSLVQRIEVDRHTGWMQPQR
ncbi:hypothetical protein [Maritimibacter sp. 55A14]|uniref:hypothetical protein n=1 Tax=Maritimibacter sp. 55A14 TaxID=2174844 RepID=UPI0011B232E1|nr:hypothetical protein [Maritimibacter sp. 55A14]